MSEEDGQAIVKRGPQRDGVSVGEENGGGCRGKAAPSLASEGTDEGTRQAQTKGSLASSRPQEQRVGLEENTSHPHKPVLTLFRSHHRH